MIILRQKMYSTRDTAIKYIDEHLLNSNGGIIVPRKWSPNGKERSRNKQTGTIVLPKPTFITGDEKEPLLTRVKRFLRKND